MIDDSQPVRWSLHDLLPGGLESLDSTLAEIEDLLKQVEAYRPKLNSELPAGDLMALLHVLESLNERCARVQAYAFLRYAEDTRDPAALSLQDRIGEIMAGVANRSLFFSLWFKDLPDDSAARLIAASGDLHYYLESLRRFKPYALSEAEEKVVNLKDVNGIQGLVKIYGILTNGFSYRLEVDGQTLTLTRDGLGSYYHHPSPDVRLAAYNELNRVYAENKTVLAQIYALVARDLRAEAVGLRGFATPISARNLGNDIPDAVVQTLLDVCRRNTGLYQRYFRLKARLLGMEKLRRCDIYAPVAQSDKAVGLKDAAALVLDSFRQFSPPVAEAAALVIDRSHLDAEVRPGKRGGAFSYGVTPDLIPWVLMNYTGRLRDVATLAHELGHSVHSILARGHSVLTHHPSLPLAETASVFGEMLVTDRLLKEETDPLVQRDLLMTSLDDAYATVQRQAFITIFEMDAHGMIAAGSTSEDLARHYLKNLAEQFGDAVEVPDDFSWEWTAIPHIYESPFYPYAYSFGQLLVLALYRQYLSGGPDFVPRYLKLLSYGGSAEPKAILEEAGLDIVSPGFWQGGFDVLTARLDRLEQIVGGAS